MPALATKSALFKARKAARAESRTAVVKCGLTRFCRDADLRSLLQNGISHPVPVTALVPSGHTDLV